MIMNITSYIQQRENGTAKYRGTSQRKAELFLESRLTKNFVNKGCEISGRCRSTFVMQFSPDGTKVASTHGDHSVRVTDISTGKCLHTLHGHPRTPWCLAYHPSFSNILASGCLGGQVRIWDLYGHGCEVWQTEDSTVIASLTFHPSDKVLVIAAGNTIYFWDWNKPEPFAKCSTGHEFERIRWIHFDSLGHMLYTGISNNISLHTDEATARLPTRVVPRSGLRRIDDSQSSRLGNVYNNIVNYYQDYRRDQLLNEHASLSSTRDSATNRAGNVTSAQQSDSLRSLPGVSQSTSSVLNSIPGTLAALRRNELLEMYVNSRLPSTRNIEADSASGNSAQSLELQIGRWRSFDNPPSVGPYRMGNVQPGARSVFSNLPASEQDLLLHPPADPFLSSVTELSSNQENPRESSITEQDNDNILQRILPHDISHDPLLSHDESAVISHDLSLDHGQEVETLEEIEVPLESVTRQYVRPQLVERRTRTRPWRTSSVPQRQSLIQDQGRIDSSAVVNNISMREHLDTYENIATSDSALSGVLGTTGSLGRGAYYMSLPRDPAFSTNLSSNRFSQTGFARHNPNELESTRSSGDIVGQSENSRSTGEANTGLSYLNCLSHMRTNPGSRNISNNSSSTMQSAKAPQSTLLKSFLTSSCKQSDNSSAGSISSKQWSSLRDRLQSSISQCSASTSSDKDKVTHTQTSGIPKVTVIMGRDSDSIDPCQNISASIPPGACGSSSNQGTTRTNVTSCSNRLMRKRSNEGLTLCDKRRSVAESTVAYSDDTKFSADSVNQSGTNIQSGVSDTAVSVANENIPVSCAPPIPVSAALTSNASAVSSATGRSFESKLKMFENIFRNSTTPSQSSGSRIRPHPPRGQNSLPSFQAQPYNLQNRARYMSLMGPYLESRGVNPIVTGTMPAPRYGAPPRYLQPEWEPLDPNSSGSEIENQQEDQASSETEVELGQAESYHDHVTEERLRNFSARSEDRSVITFSNQSAQSVDSTMTRVSGAGSSHSRPIESSNVRQTSSSAQGQSSRSDSLGNEVELVVDQNENYTTNRNASMEVARNQNIVHRNHDSNNNSIHFMSNTNPGGGPSQPNQDYVRLRDSFVSMTDQIEREMNDLNRRINALRDSFNESIRSLRHDRRRYETLEGNLPAETATNLGHQYSGEEVVTGNSSAGRLNMTGYPAVRDPDTIQDIVAEIGTGVPVSQPPTLLETSLRSHAQIRQPLHSRLPQQTGDGGPEDSHHWRTLQRHYLHPHYSSSILDETINRPHNVFQSAINRAIAGAFMGAGESSVANNIMSQTHRIQFWDFTKCHIPDISQSNINIVVPHCKLHNSASADISQDNSLLATFVPNHQGFPDNNILAVYSLLPATRGQCLYTKQFGPNAVSVSISPSNSYVLVCLAARRLTWVFSSQQLVGQIFKLEKKHAGEHSMKHIKDVDHSCSSEIRTHVSGNSARWLPLPGQGLVYGTNRGDLNICKPGVKVVTEKVGTSDTEDAALDDSTSFYESVARTVSWGLASLQNPRWSRVNSATQTVGQRLNAGTQTPSEPEDV